MPAPTPAKCKDDNPRHPASASRSSTAVDDRISAKAPAPPPTKRRIRNHGTDAVKPMPAVVSALAANEPSSHSRRDPARVGAAASNAPIR